MFQSISYVLYLEDAATACGSWTKFTTALYIVQSRTILPVKKPSTITGSEILVSQSVLSRTNNLGNGLTFLLESALRVGEVFHFVHV